MQDAGATAHRQGRTVTRPCRCPRRRPRRRSSSTCSSSMKAANAAERVGAAADARDDPCRQAPLPLEDLRPGLVADHALQVAHERRVGRGTDDRADHVVGALHVRDPVADRGRGRLLQRSGTGVDRRDRRSQQLHALDVRPLPARVLDPHVDDALHVEQRADSGRCDTVLAGARLGDDAPLAHALREQHLSERVVELVRPRVVEVLPLQIDGPAERARRCAAPDTAAWGARRSRAEGRRARRGSPGRRVRRPTPARAPRGRASASRARTDRRTPRSGARSRSSDLRAAARSCAPRSRRLADLGGAGGRPFDGFEERSQPLRVLVAGRSLGPARSVDGPWVCRRRSPRRRSARAGRRSRSAAPSTAAPRAGPSRTSPPSLRAARCAPDREARASSRWKSTWNRSRSRTSPGPDTCAALITRAPVRRAASPQNDGPSSPCSCNRLSPTAWLVSTICSSGAFTNTPQSCVLRRRTAPTRCACSSDARRGLPS